MPQVEKIVALRSIDILWMNHLEEMESLRDSVRLRAYGQKDPLVEYKTEGHRMFQQLLGAIEDQIVNTMLKASLKSQPKSEGTAPAAPASSSGKTPGRNDPCPCGAKYPDGRPIKYKKCCGKNS